MVLRGMVYYLYMYVHVCVCEPLYIVWFIVYICTYMYVSVNHCTVWLVVHTCTYIVLYVTDHFHLFYLLNFGKLVLNQFTSCWQKISKVAIKEYVWLINSKYHRIRKAISWSVTVHNKKISSQWNVSAQIEAVQDK
jgi:hypothetical protein